MLGKLFQRTQPATESRAITEFAVIDGQKVFGSEFGTGRYRGGMSIPGAWRSAVLLSDLLGSVPWHAYRSRAGRQSEKVEPNPLILEQPNPPETRMNTFSAWALDLIWHGNAIGVVASRNAEGWPTSIIGVPADYVFIRRTPLGVLEYRIGQDDFFSGDVLHIKGPCAPGALRGMGVLEAHLDTLQLADEQKKQATGLATNGVPTGLLKATSADVTEEDAANTKKGWLEAQRTRTIAFLGPGTDFQPLSWNPEEMQLVEARKFSLHEICLIFGLPLYFLGVEQSNRTYSNVEMEAINLIKFSLSGHLSRFEQSLSLHLPHGTVAKANLDSILRADTLSRYQAHEIALRSGFLTTNEVREFEDREPLPEPQVSEEEEPDEDV